MTSQSPDLASLRTRWREIRREWDSTAIAIDNDLHTPMPYISPDTYKALFDLIEEIVAMLTP